MHGVIPKEGLAILVVPAKLSLVMITGKILRLVHFCNVAQMLISILQLDIASLIPLDLLYLMPQVNYNSLVRLPRLLKVNHQRY